MLISTRGRYSLRIMTDLAEHRAEGYIPLKTLAERQGISEKYLESIMKLLVREHLLEGHRGKGGGYKLTREPKEYTVYSVLKVTEDSLAPVACLDDHALACPRVDDCRTISLWQGLDKVIRDYLSGVTIADLM
ncbi:MAG: Rrf2 family transcriptional regulator, partial [Oscillospiraceae bacterium]|nr:Rrf2 family transcriptional regulator [Oscillospiraceae bacterium]